MRQKSAPICTFSGLLVLLVRFTDQTLRPVKVKLSSGLTKYHAMKTYGRMEV